MHRFQVLTLFPDFFQSPLEVSILKRAREQGLLQVGMTDIREFSENRHKKTDDYPYGGGAGMVMTPQPLHDAIMHAKELMPKALVTAFTPKGVLFKQDKAKEFVLHQDHILVCGHYEGIDERIIDHYCDLELSIGDYILTGGEYAALVYIDTLARLLEGVLQNSDSTEEESFDNGLLEYDHYTRPEEFRGFRVPDVLLSGNHPKVHEWRRANRLHNTKESRPDLYRKLKGEQDNGYS